jgi:SP family general alpha glucoside:H+ symporter-like MFS transporter
MDSKRDEKVGDHIGSTDSPLQFPERDELQHSKSMNEVIRNAKNATEKEHKMSILQGIRLYPKAVAWSLLISTCICMEGYDVCLLSNFCE